MAENIDMIQSDSSDSAVDSSDSTIDSAKGESELLSKFIQDERLEPNENGKFLPDKRQLKRLVNCVDDCLDKTNKLISLKRIDTSNVKNMKALFYKSNREDFDGIEEWNVSSVVGFELCFAQCKTFNAEIEKWGDKVKNARTFEAMFWGAESFDRPIGAHWDTSSATNMIRMFNQAKNFNNGEQPFGDKWKMDKVGWTWQMFWGAERFNQELNHWNMSSVTKCFTMFMNAKVFNKPLDKWDLSNAVDLSNMFNKAESFNQDLSAWGNKLGKAQNMKRMFADTKSLNREFIGWKVPKDCDRANMTKGSALKIDIAFIGDIELTKEILQDSTQSGEQISTTKAQLASNIKNFTIHQIVKGDKNISHESYKNAVDSFINKHLKSYNRKELYGWIPKNIREDYKIYLAKNENAVICGADEDKWDFICYKIFDYFFIVVSNNATLDIPQGLLKQHEKRTLTIKQEAIDEDDEDLEFGRDIHYKGNSLRISLEDNQEMYIYNGNSNQDIQNSDRILNIIGALILAKAYESKMYDFNKMARQAKGADLMKWHKEICAFDLKYYQNVPVLVYNAPLLEFWGKLANRYKINDRHNELQETIARVAQLVSDEMRERENKIREAENKKRDKISIAIGVATVIIGILSALGALPVIRNFFN